MLRALTFLAAAVGLTACGSASGPVSGADCGSGIAPQDIASAEVAALTAHDVVDRLCPLWLHTRGVASVLAPVDVVVYVDDTRAGGPDGLRLVPASDLAAIRHLSPADAGLRYGRGHSAGAILVSTRRR